MLSPVGAVIATISIDNDADGYAEALAWIAEHAPGPRVVVGLEGTRSYGVGLSRALQAAGLTWSRSSDPNASAAGARASPTRSTRTWRRWLCCGCRRPESGAPHRWDREALRILLGRPQRDRTTRPGRSTGCGRCCSPARTPTGTWPAARCTRPPRRPSPVAAAAGDETTEQAVRRAEARRLAIAIRAAERADRQHKQLASTGRQLRPGPARPIRRRPGHRRAGDRVVLPPRPVPQRGRVRRPGRRQPRSRPAAGEPTGTASTGAGTGNSTGPCTSSP